MHAQVQRALPHRTGELTFTTLPELHRIDHALTLEQLEHFGTYKRRRQLERDFLFRRKRKEIHRILDAFEWGLGASVPTRAPETLRAVAWNIERGKRFDALSEHFQRPNQASVRNLVFAYLMRHSQSWATLFEQCH